MLAHSGILSYLISFVTPYQVHANMRFSRPLTLLICSFQHVLCYEGACLDGISTAITEFVFRGGTPDDYYGNLCTNKLSVHSMWAAAKLYCRPREITAGEKLIGGWCTEYGSVTLVPYSKVLPDLTDDYISSLQVVNYRDINETKTWNKPVLLSQGLAFAGEKTTVRECHCIFQLLNSSRLLSTTSTNFTKT